ncbi:MAG: hypothetical protein ACJ79V_19160 [Myxococcales bacterium]
MSKVPSTGLVREIEECPDCGFTPREAIRRADLCQPHRSRWNLEACMTAGESDERAGGEGYLERLVRRAIATEDGTSGFLSALECQARALDMIWEAHKRGAAQLPAPVAASVERARTAMPGYLRGSATAGQGTRAQTEERAEAR